MQDQTGLKHTMTSIVGKPIDTYRYLTGLRSFDLAFKSADGKIGLPVRGIMQVAGASGLGKSTLVYSLAGMTACHIDTNISLADIENHFDAGYAVPIFNNAGFTGEVKLENGTVDSTILSNQVKTLKDGTHLVGIIDSIGGVSPTAEEDGDLDAANMGRRAQLISKYTGRVIHVQKQWMEKGKPSLVFATNHVHQKMGGMAKGVSTSGGVKKDYLSTVQVILSYAEKDELGILLKGKVTKNTFGYSNRIFHVYLIYGYGIHPGITAVHDCLNMGLADKSRVVKLGGKSYGYMKDIIKSSSDPELFKPFQDALNGVTVDSVSDDDGGDEDD